MVLDNVNKLRNGQPNCELYYATTGTWLQDPVLVATSDQVVADLKATRFFNEVTFSPFGFDELRREWIATRASAEAKFSVLGELPMPPMEGINEALIVLVSANEFVQKVLCDDKGNLRTGVFEQNVRHFLGGDNDVNGQIRQTIENSEKKHRFAILNNGITIVAKEIKRVANTVAVRDFQIVNGCQTSHVLYHERANLDKDVILVVKAISSARDGVVDEVVVATNSQTKVAESQFFATKEEVRAIQSYFASFSGEDEDDGKLFFERRIGEFADRAIASVRIFDIHLLAKVYASMFLDVPHDALGSPSRIYDAAELFTRPDVEIAYYTAAFAYYRVILMLGNNQLPRTSGHLKWHLLTALRHQTMGGLPNSAAPAAIEVACKKLLKIIKLPPKDCLHLFTAALSAVQVTLQGKPLQDLRAKPFTDKLILKCAPNKSAKRPRAAPKLH